MRASELSGLLGSRLEWAARVSIALLASALALEAYGAREWWLAVAVARSDWGAVGMFFIPLAIALAGLVATPRSPVRAGVALGFLAPSALPMLGEFGALHPAMMLAHATLTLTCGWTAWRAVRESTEPAALRLKITATGVGALLVCALASVCWWPRDYTLHGLGPPIPPTPHVVIAAVLLAWTIRDLAARRTRALLGVAVAGACIALAPHFGEHQAGCMSAPGPLDLLLFPRLIAPAILLLWIAPTYRWLRGSPEAPEPLAM